MAPARQPIFNVPGVVLALVAVLCAIQLVTDYMNPLAQFRILAEFAFVPARFTVAYDPTAVARAFNAAASNSESAAELATFFLGDGRPSWHTALTYAFLHGGWTHVGVNCLWLVAFGSALARRFGTPRFLAFCALCAVGGALAHYLTHLTDFQPMVGASAVVSGAMAAVVRFAFQPGAPLNAAFGFDRSHRAYRLPALPLREVLSNRTALSFLGLWFLANFVFGAFPQTIGMTDASIAWQAHVGGFLAGLLTFSWFDPPAERAPPAPSES
ncbi:rhomboid family intramembrane serine protease [Methylocella sp.]|uniref:rhomboid family intramembrane serine protease n=1 Tax=Methylocella sp. TaxID=1978226 RepID=UPI0037847A80